jgi:hypothetical protein
VVEERASASVSKPLFSLPHKGKLGSELSVPQAEADVLVAAVTWAEQHPPESIHLAATWHTPGGDTGLPLAGPGAPLVSEFSIAEFALAIGLSTDSGRNLIATAVELKYCLPRLWARIHSTPDPGLQPWRARRIAQATRLSVEAARYVDDMVAGFAHKIGPAQLDRLVEEAIARFMPDLAAENAERAADARHVTFHHQQVSFNGTTTVEAELDLADALDLDLDLDAADLSEKYGAVMLALAADTNMDTETYIARKPSAPEGPRRSDLTVDERLLILRLNHPSAQPTHQDIRDPSHAGDSLGANGPDPERRRRAAHALLHEGRRQVAVLRGGRVLLMFGIGPVEIAILVLSLVNIGLGLWAIMDAASWPEGQWTAAGRSKGIWLTLLTLVAIVGCFTFGWVGALLYALIPRRAIVRASGSSGR